ncbi:hypothetical protein ACTFIT_002955 [Dictyostelium discoideum]
MEKKKQKVEQQISTNFDNMNSDRMKTMKNVVVQTIKDPTTDEDYKSNSMERMNSKPIKLSIVLVSYRLSLSYREFRKTILEDLNGHQTLRKKFHINYVKAVITTQPRNHGFDFCLIEHAARSLTSLKDLSYRDLKLS